MKVMKIEVAPTFTLELTEREAQSLVAITYLDYTIPETLRASYPKVDASAAGDLLCRIRRALRDDEWVQPK